MKLSRKHNLWNILLSDYFFWGLEKSNINVENNNVKEDLKINSKAVKLINYRVLNFIEYVILRSEVQSNKEFRMFLVNFDYLIIFFFENKITFNRIYYKISMEI